MSKDKLKEPELA